ncbi:hypothetical protein GCM10012275_33390 [Longimycelium tulufanense]|uniref:Secreted protein n=1 Tax=Longimycelium tulufanense TaxID=907463 RepID=A0A8J3CGY5_9PSEU|nr:hypothetical protein [Longimycelium tulufanense]GGM59593.1 hypothetical protein GCM10012275_33390 [Longimycelium tulufanense]
MSSRTFLRRLSSVAGGVAVASALGVAVATPASAAETNPRCASSVQIGDTGYLKGPGGTTVASVKQFKGCGKNYAYIYLWKAYQGKGLRPCAAVGIGRDKAKARTAGNYCAPAGAREVWSYGTNTLSQCTFAIGWVRGEPVEGHSEVRC